MAGLNDSVQGYTGNRYQLTTLIGTGGEGSVYDTNVPGMVAKIYDTSKDVIAGRMSELQKKITYMVTRLQLDVVSKTSGNCLVSWPQDVLYENGKFVGYLMHKISGANPFQMIQRGNPSASKAIPGYDWKKALLVAENLAKILKAMHANNIVIGDLNNNNILVYPNCEVVLVDTDSFDIRTDRGEHYKCKVGREGYLPPELIGKNLGDKDTCFSQKSDEFALAVHIFVLLTGNNHPFNVKLEDISVSSDELNPDYNISVGNCPFLRYIPGCTIPLGAPYIHDLLPDYLVNDFKNTFGYQLDTKSSNYYAELSGAIYRRTSADTWFNHLNRLNGDDSLIRCSNNKEHYHLKGKKCEMCAAEDRKKAAFQKAMNDAQQSAQQTSKQEAKQSAHQYNKTTSQQASNNAKSKQYTGNTAQKTTQNQTRYTSQTASSNANTSRYVKPLPTCAVPTGSKRLFEVFLDILFCIMIFAFLADGNWVEDAVREWIKVPRGIQSTPATIVTDLILILAIVVVCYIIHLVIEGRKKQKLYFSKSQNQVTISWDNYIMNYAIGIGKRWIETGSASKVTVPLDAFPAGQKTEVMLVQMVDRKPKRVSWKKIKVDNLV